MKHNHGKVDLPYLAFLFAICTAVYLAGAVTAKKNIQPFPSLVNSYRSLIKAVDQITQIRPKVLEPISHKQAGVSVHFREKAFQGYTLAQGVFAEGVGAKLLDMDGTLIHWWPIDFFAIWPKPSHIHPEQRIPKTSLNYHSQGYVANKDGSIVVNLGNLGTAKLDKCANVLWTVNRSTHHAITKDENGGYWLLANADIPDIPDYLLKLSGLSHKLLTREAQARYENLLLHVNAQGVITQELSILKALVDAGMERLLFDGYVSSRYDPTHANDIDLVTPRLAEKIDGVNVGDLLVSIRQTHLLIIMDAKTGAIKWHYAGPWIRQHDPDIMPNGNIVVYNNARESLSLDRVAGSNLIEFDPATNQTQIIYPKDGQTAFYSMALGNHQLLPNGNRLINESLRGRVFEVDASGETVWSYVEHYDEEYAALLEVVERLPLDYFDVEDWNCS